MIDSLGDRMKNYEAKHKTFLEPQTYTIIRLDGKAFHTFTKKFDKPFDLDIQYTMSESMKTLLKEIPGSRIGYTQSDEISILLTDFDKPTTQQWYGGNIQKMTSVSASILTLAFNTRISTSDSAYFDSRVFTLPTKSEVMNYFKWRKDDCNRNAISAVAQSFFSHKQLHGVGNVAKLVMLEEIGVDYFYDYTKADRNGVVAFKEPRLETIQYTRKDTGETLYEDVPRNVTTTQAVGDGDFFEGFVYDNTPELPK